ncbi:kinase [Gallibacterium salpingitidis]|uniref:kinase n=1 Tax=Gallibacterium salpingitidis TaxID=505341 RepID=UPI002670781E|nr:kinase [Gallibacterium salpingitidis]WKS98985.1 kinase [Gallibacterium salpingitidis]
MNFSQYVADLVAKNPDERVFPFNYEGKKYWIKQVEKTTGAMRLLKPNPKASLQREIKTLQYLNQHHAAVAQLVLVSDNYFVIEDVGQSIKRYLNEPQTTAEFAQRMLADAARALATLHQQNLFHGRPAIRDMGWKEDGVRFIDFESKIFSNNLHLQQARDLLFYIHSLYVSEKVTDQQIADSITVYRQQGGEAQWQYTYALVVKYRWLYSFLRLFRCVARTDLIALLSLFKFIFAYGKEKGF